MVFEIIFGRVSVFIVISRIEVCGGGVGRSRVWDGVGGGVVLLFFAWLDLLVYLGYYVWRRVD